MATKIKKCSIKLLTNYTDPLEYVDRYPSAIQFVSECYKTQEMCHKAINALCFIMLALLDLILFLIDIRLKKCVINLFLKSLKKHCFDIFKTQKICDKAVDDIQPKLKFVLDSLLQINWLKSFIILSPQMMITVLLEIRWCHVFK